MAAGCEIHPEKLDAFRQRPNEIARRSLRPEDLQPPLRLDAEVGLAEISLESLAQLDRLKPMGQGNPAAQFYAAISPTQAGSAHGGDKQHVKMWVDGRRGDA